MTYLRYFEANSSPHILYKHKTQPIHKYIIYLNQQSNKHFRAYSYFTDTQLQSASINYNEQGDLVHSASPHWKEGIWFGQQQQQKMKLNGPGRSKLEQGRNSWRWPKHAWLSTFWPTRGFKGENLRQHLILNRGTRQLNSAIVAIAKRLWLI